MLLPLWSYFCPGTLPELYPKFCSSLGLFWFPPFCSLWPPSKVTSSWLLPQRDYESPHFHRLQARPHGCRQLHITWTKMNTCSSKCCFIVFGWQNRHTSSSVRNPEIVPESSRSLVYPYQECHCILSILTPKSLWNLQTLFRSQVAVLISFSPTAISSY